MIMLMDPDSHNMAAFYHINTYVHERMKHTHSTYTQYICINYMHNYRLLGFC